MSSTRQADLKAGGLALLGVGVLATLPSPRPDVLAFGLLAALAGMAWRPWVGPALVGATLPVYFFPQQLGRISFSPPGLVLVLAWASLLVRVGWDRGRGRPAALTWPTTGYDGPLALFLLAGLLSLLVTQYPLQSVRELRALIFEPVLFFWLLAATARHAAAKAALGGFLVAAVVVALIAAVQVLSGSGGTEAEGVRRAQAWYPQPNHLALMLGRALPFALALGLVGRPGEATSRGQAWRLAALAWFAVASVGLGLLLTFSLGAWLGATAAAVVVLAALRRRRAAISLSLLAAGLFAAVSLLAIAGAVPERLNPLRQTTGFRLELWQSSIAMVADHPLLGVGLDNFVYLYQQVYLREGAAAEANLSHPHNWILNVWLQLGLLGLVAFVWLLVRFWRSARARLATGTDAWIAAGALGAMAETLVHGLLDNSYFLVDLAFLFWLILAAVARRVAR